MARKLNAQPDLLEPERSGCEARLITINRFARLNVGLEKGLARIHNISNQGLELSTTISLVFGQTVRLDLSELITTNATVASKDGNRHVLKFAQLVNCASLLSQLVEDARSGRARPLRLTTGRMQANGQSPDGLHSVEVENISQRGMGVRHDGSFRPGLRVCVQLPNGLECRGIVRWTKDQSAGLVLIDTLSADDLGAVSRLSERPSSPHSCPRLIDDAYFDRQIL